MGFTYDQDYVKIPGAATAARMALKGQAHHSYWAQTVARNLAHCMAEKSAPVVLCGGGNVIFGDDQDSTGSYTTACRGCSLIWKPFVDIDFTIKRKKGSGSGNGSLRVQAWAAERTSNTMAAKVTDEDTAISDANFAVGTFTLSSVPVPDSGIVWVYVDIINCHLYWVSAYARAYSG